MLSQKRCARCAPFTPRHDRLGGGVGLFGTRTNAVGLQTCPVGTCPHAVGLCTDRPGLRLFRPRGLQAYRLIGPLAWVPRPKRRRCGALPGAAPGRPGPVGRWVHLGLGGLGGRRPTN